MKNKIILSILGILALSCLLFENIKTYVGVEVGYYTGYPIGYYYDCSYPSCWYGWGYPNYAYAPYWGTYEYAPDYKYSLGYYNTENSCTSKCYRDCRRTSGMSATECRTSCEKRCAGDASWTEKRRHKHHEHHGRRENSCTNCR